MLQSDVKHSGVRECGLVLACQIRLAPVQGHANIVKCVSYNVLCFSWGTTGYNGVTACARPAAPPI
eukprot:4948815-Pyramimonas_sp.AAC.1